VGGVGDILGQLFETFLSVFPRLIVVEKTHGGVRFRRGKKVLELKPGIHWYWPLVTEVVTLPVVRQPIDLYPQVITLQNGSVVVSGTIVYEIRDSVAALAETHDIDDLIQNVGRVALFKQLTGSKWSDTMSDHSNGELRRNLTTEARKQLKKYGVHVFEMSLTDFAKCVVIRNFGNDPVIPVQNDED
jgi:regulator of protease activity HflC (stomatin/prohibitin superfamily)